MVLPGVGHFGEAMRRIRASRLDTVVHEAAGRGLPVLGICLGLQLLFDESEESPGETGLGLLPGAVRRLRTERKLPHIGWSRVRWQPGSVLAPEAEDDASSTYYFVHTFGCEPEDPRPRAGAGRARRRLLRRRRARGSDGRPVPPGEVERGGPRPAGPLGGGRRRPRRAGLALVITLYPAIDLQGGQAVRLRQGDFDQSTAFSDDPVDQAKRFAEDGALSLHVVDLDGARAGEPVHAALVASIAAAFPGTVHLGGGLRSRPAIETALATGVNRVVLGTAVIDDHDLLAWAIDRLGDGLVVALDARQGKVATHGWTQVTDRDAVEVATGLVSMGVRRLAYTDINRDGTLGGPNLAAMRRLAEAAPPLRLIASGGISSLDDLRRLRDLGIANLDGVIVGRALYEGRFTIGEALRVLDGAG